MVKRQPRDSILKIFEVFRRKQMYTTRIRVQQRYGDTEVGVVEFKKKKSLVEDKNPMYLEGVRTIRKSDSAIPQTLGQPGQDGSRPRIFTHTAVPIFDGTRYTELGITGITRILLHEGEGPGPNGVRQVHCVSTEL